MKHLIIKPDRGIKLVLRPLSQPAWRAAATKEPALVQIFMSDASQPVGTGQLIGVAPVGGVLEIDFTPELDRKLRFTPVSIAEDGARDVSMLSEANSVYFTLQRETVAPEIGQVGDSDVIVEGPDTNALVVTGAKGFGPHARLMKVEVADDAAMETNLEVTIYDRAESELPRLVRIKRPATTAQTRYVRISYSAGTGYGPTSNILEVTFPAADGTGGSTGDFDPNPRADLEINLP